MTILETIILCIFAVALAVVLCAIPYDEDNIE